MNLSMRWLKEFVPVDMPIRSFTEAMTMSGSKVESYEIVNNFQLSTFNF